MINMFSFFIIRVALLLTGSASCSRRRQYPLKLFNKEDISNYETLGDNTAIGQKRKSIKFEDDIETDVAKSSSSNQVEDHKLLGHSSENPLTIRNNTIVKHGKIKINHFIGDRQPITAVRMAHLFGAHPTPQNGAIPITPAGKSNIDEHTSTTTPLNIESTMGDHIVQESPLLENQNNIINQNSSNINTENTTKPRFIYDQQDEPIRYAGVNVELPSTELLEFIRNLSSNKIIKYENRHNIGSYNPVTSESTLIRKFDNTALIAIGIILEELIRDMILNWYKSGSPLGFEPRTLRTEALVQMNGSSSINPTDAGSEITLDMLQNILEVKFMMFIYILLVYECVYSMIYVLYIKAVFIVFLYLYYIISN